MKVGALRAGLSLFSSIQRPTGLLFLANRFALGETGSIMGVYGR